MKKQFPLHASNKAVERVLDSIKHDVRKYVKRERNKSLPEGFNTWEFDCRVGLDAPSAEARALPDVGSAIDAVAATGAESVYVEVVARPGHRTPQARTPATPAPEGQANVG